MSACGFEMLLCFGKTFPTPVLALKQRIRVTEKPPILCIVKLLTKPSSLESFSQIQVTMSSIVCFLDILVT